MASIRVRDWTKEQIEKIREEESHSSHDSVIKALLKDRELAKFAGTAVDDESAEPADVQVAPPEKAFDDLTVLAELHSADNGILFLWCPNCGSEIAHAGFENPLSLSVIEIECQRCLTRLDQHATVAIEIGYPIEERIVEETLLDDLKKCVIDYWDRTLERLADGSLDDEVIDDDRFVWQCDQYLREFDWDWPTDVPVVGLREGHVYRNEITGERIEVLHAEEENRNTIDDFRVRIVPDDADENVETELLDSGEGMNLLISRSLYLSDETVEDTTTTA